MGTGSSGRGPLYLRVAGLPVTVEGQGTQLLSRPVSSGFIRYTTRLTLLGKGAEGAGEDVTYEEELQKTRPAELASWDPRGTYTLAEFSALLEESFPAADRHYTRWAYESAAFDLALKQAGLGLPDVFGQEYAPLRFVVSTRLGSPPSAQLPLAWLSYYPNLEFKLDPQSSWSDELARRLSATDRVRVVDLKGAYVGTPVDQPFDERLYRLVAEIFWDAYIEDPAPCDAALNLLADVRDRISWDAVIHSAEDIRGLAYRPGAINIKPSRFGSLRRLLEAVEYCREQKIPMYGGGQFELGPGRAQIQALASLFYPQGPNDVAPPEFNHGDPRPGLPVSPLLPEAGTLGFCFTSAAS